jgi:2'-5' RNA ligase
VAEESRKLAFWLVPERGTQALFEPLIRELAAEFDAPVFEPHVTLQGADVGEAEALRALRDVCASYGAIELEISGIEHSPKYTKTLYVQFRPSAAATALSDAVRDRLACSSNYEFNPHLSLLYKELPDETKRAAAAEVRLPFDRMRCDRVKVISTPASIKTAAEVHAWRTLGECNLAMQPT